MNLISVIITTYNREKYIELALKSALKQKNVNFEIIIIDDESTDNTTKIISPYLSDKRIKYYKIKKSSSISQTRNKALPYINGDYVAILDSDDIWNDDLKLKKQLDIFLNNKNVVLVGTAATIIDKNGAMIKNIIKPLTDEKIRKELFLKNPFFHSSVVYRKRDAQAVGWYNEDIKFGEDMDLWIKLSEKGKLMNLPETMIKYRVHKNNEASKNFFGAIFGVLKVINLHRKKHNLSIFIYIKKVLIKINEYLPK